MLPLFKSLAGLVVILLLAIFAFKKEMLSESGTLAAIVMGAAIFVLPVPPYEGWVWFCLLSLFFLSSSLATRFKAHAKKEVNADFAKGGVRDFAQVAANGAVPLFLAAVYHFYSQPVVFTAFVASLAVVTADTFATEIGVLSKGRPFLVTSFKRVERGCSGAVSLLGSGAGAAASLFIAFSASFLLSLSSVFAGKPELVVPGGSPAFFLVVFVAGVAGMFADSLLGATVQVMYFCDSCGKETERKVHKCGRATRFLRGAKWFDNDVTNLFSAIIGAAIATALFYLLVC
ncbi:MAG: DUF92 domain-containing protein [Candidatus Micrarchaeia archaeon]